MLHVSPEQSVQSIFVMLACIHLLIMAYQLDNELCISPGKFYQNALDVSWSARLFCPKCSE